MSLCWNLVSLPFHLLPDWGSLFNARGGASGLGRGEIFVFWCWLVFKLCQEEGGAFFPLSLQTCLTSRDYERAGQVLSLKPLSGRSRATLWNPSCPICLRLQFVVLSSRLLAQFFRSGSSITHSLTHPPAGPRISYNNHKNNFPEDSSEVSRPTEIAVNDDFPQVTQSDLWGQTQVITGVYHTLIISVRELPQCRRWS